MMDMDTIVTKMLTIEHLKKMPRGVKTQIILPDVEAVREAVRVCKYAEKALPCMLAMTVDEEQRRIVMVKHYASSHITSRGKWRMRGI